MQRKREGSKGERGDIVGMRLDVREGGFLLSSSHRETGGCHTGDCCLKEVI